MSLLITFDFSRKTHLKSGCGVACVGGYVGAMLVSSVEISEISVKLVNLKNSVKFSKIQRDSNLLKFLKLTMYVIYG